MASSAVSSVLYLRDAAGNHADRVQAHTSTMEAQQVSMNGNSALDYALKVNLVIKTLKRCLKTVMDCVATLLSRHKIDNLCEIIDGRPCGIDTVISRMRGMFFSLTSLSVPPLPFFR